METPKLILIVLDGWGYSRVRAGNAILQANLPTFDYLWGNYPHTLLQAFGKDVGLPWGATGSSEVGHQVIGSGKKIVQEYSYVDRKISNESFFSNKKLEDFVKAMSKERKSIHLIGLLSDGGVHSHIDHLFAILGYMEIHEVKNRIYLHVITDGRDCQEKSVAKYITQLNGKLNSLKLDIKIATVIGRYYAMDRDNNWDRTKKAFEVIANGVGETVLNVGEAINANYKKGLTDEFFLPTSIKLEEPETSGWLRRLFAPKRIGRPGVVQAGDGLFFFNIRADRMRQLVELFVPGKKKVACERPKGIKILTLTTYDENLPVTVVYPNKKVKNPLAKVLSDNGLTQGHFAETEKYAHVTYFFNGGNTEPFAGEKWYLIDSPKVSTFDLKPEMSAEKITEKVISVAKEKRLDVVLINYANADMVGHTGIMDATIKAVECIDKQLKRICETFPNSIVMITADHGNAEAKMNQYHGEVQKNHTTNPVPFILMAKKFNAGKRSPNILRSTGTLSDVAPTVLNLLGIEIPTNMDGYNLIETDKREAKRSKYGKLD